MDASFTCKPVFNQVENESFSLKLIGGICFFSESMYPVNKSTIRETRFKKHIVCEQGFVRIIVETPKKLNYEYTKKPEHRTHLLSLAQH